MRPLPADIVIYRPDGAFVAAVEVKNREGLTADIATSLHRSIIENGLVSRDVPYFLLVSQDHGYLWRDSRNPDAPPDFEFDMAEVVRRFAPGNLSGRLRPSELELIVYFWLAQIAQSGIALDLEPERTLERTGFSQAIRGAVLTRDVA